MYPCFIMTLSATYTPQMRTDCLRTGPESVRIENYTDLLHLGIEVSVAICNNELNCFVGYLFIRGFHGDAPDKIHPCQVKAFHALKSGNIIRLI